MSAEILGHKLVTRCSCPLIYLLLDNTKWTETKILRRGVMVAEDQITGARTRARYKELLGRVQIDLRLTHDAALAVGLEFKRLARLKRAMREISDELREV